MESAVFAPRPRFLAEADCHDIVQRLDAYATGGGYTGVWISSAWRGNVRWARNLVSAGSDVQQNHLVAFRSINGANCHMVQLNSTADDALMAAVRRAERLARLEQERPGTNLYPYVKQDMGLSPAIFSETTVQLGAEERATAAQQLSQSSAKAGMLSAGYIEVSANSMAFLTSWGLTRYFQYTSAQYSVTVRDPAGTGSGWAGLDWHDWSKIKGEELSAIALDKCLKSQNPVRIEPGRYTTILEPQAVGQLVRELMKASSGTLNSGTFSRPDAEGSSQPFNKIRSGSSSERPGFSKLGERLIDERITISSDPIDPELGFPPWGWNLVNDYPITGLSAPVYHPAVWFERGVLKNLAYSAEYARVELGQTPGLPLQGAFRMSGGDTSIAEMIATTKRGMLVTRFDSVHLMEYSTVLCRGYTRDGLWLIENGAISKPAKNLAFTESPLFILNQVEQLGVPQRIFNPPTNDPFALPQPIVAPPLKVRDFSFTALTDAV